MTSAVVEKKLGLIPAHKCRSWKKSWAIVLTNQRLILVKRPKDSLEDPLFDARIRVESDCGNFDTLAEADAGISISYSRLSRLLLAGHDLRSRLKPGDLRLRVEFRSPEGVKQKLAWAFWPPDDFVREKMKKVDEKDHVRSFNTMLLKYGESVQDLILRALPDSAVPRAEFSL